MKLKLLLLLPVLSVYSLSAQLVISPGAQLTLTGNTILALQNTSLVNNGIFNPGNSLVRFTGNAGATISGSQPTAFFELEIDKTNNTSVSLERAIAVSQRVLFSNGFLDLNGFNTDLGTTGHLDGEQDNARFIGPNGGEVVFQTSLNAPAGSNPANLGMFITSNENLGNLVIRRGHQSQTNGSGLGKSILRYYQLVPANNVNLNATLRFHYMPGELNGLDENAIVFFESQNNTSWNLLGLDTRNTALHFVTKTGINTFARFTLSTIDNPLPVRFVSFLANCQGENVLLTWKTAQEQNSSLFRIESSQDGIRWNVIGTIPAAGNSNTETSYSFTDINAAKNLLYRIAEQDRDGNEQFTTVLRTSCATPDAFSLWPNPFHDQVRININTSFQSDVLIKVFDGKGALVKLQKAAIVPGSNQINLHMEALANGVYHLSVIWDNGRTVKTVQVLKQ